MALHYFSIFFQILIAGLIEHSALAYNYSGNYWGRSTFKPIISITLDPQASLNSSFRIAVREAREEDALRFLNKKADINSHSDKGDTALLYAARNCSVDIVKVLISKGADVKLQDKEGRTALIFAAQSSCLPVTEILMSTPGVDPFHTDEAHKTAKDYALENASLDVDGPSLDVVALLEASLLKKNQVHKTKKQVNLPFARIETNAQ